MRKYYLIALLLLPLFTIAQSNYKTAYVVNLKGDTLRGYIDYKEWWHNPKKISFKQTQGEKPQQLGISDIKHFEIEGRVSYHEYTVKLSLNRIDISSPPSLADTTSATDSVFLKILQKGKNVTLYSYADGLKERFYINDGGLDVPIELLYGVYQDPKSSDNTIINKTTYRSQLTRMAVKYKAGDDKLIEQIQQASYKESDLASIAARINGNTPRQSSPKSENNNPLFRLYVGGAFSSNTLKSSVSRGSDYLYGASPSTSNAPKIAVGIDAFANPDVGHLVFRMELAYSVNNYTLTGIPNPIYNMADPVVGSLSLKQNLFAVTPQVIYNVYNAATLKAFVDLGCTFNFASYPTRDFTVLRNGQPIAAAQSDCGAFKSLYSAFQFKAGVVLSKRFEIYGAYFPGSEIMGTGDVYGNLSSYQFGLNYFWSRVAH